MAFPPPMVQIMLGGPFGRKPVDIVLDSGSACCLFPEWMATTIGLQRPHHVPSARMGSSVSQTGWTAWFATVELAIEDPAGILPPIRWTSIVGFTGAGSFQSGTAGIL